MQKMALTILNAQGQPINLGSVQVKDTYSGANVTLYEDNETTTKANPALSDASGLASWKCNNGVYDLIVSDGANQKTISAVKISDGAELHLLTNSEGSTIAYGKVCYLHTDGTVRLAKNNGTAAEANAQYVCLTRGGLANGAKGVFSGVGRVDELSGLTAGSLAWLSTSGDVTTTALDPLDSANFGKFRVFLGICLASTQLNFNPSEAIQI